MGNDSSKSSKSSSGLASSLGLKSGPSNSTVQRHLETAQKSRILQLKGCGLKKIPECVSELAEVIRNLDLSLNKIQELPRYIGGFTQLKQIHFSDNVLGSLPDEIGCVKTLEVLNLHQNKLNTLPSSLASCISLKTLTLSANCFSTFPSVVCHMIELTTLNLSDNTIEYLTDEIATCRASEINLNRNRLSSLCSSGLAQCPNLKILRVEENCLPKSEFDRELLESSNVAIICYTGNPFQDTEFQHLGGYEAYQDRYTATKRKM